MTYVLEARELSRTFIGGDGNPLNVLRGINLTVEKGKMIAIVGESGSGKSTFLQLLGALDKPSSGQVFLGGISVTGRSEEELAAIRNRTVGFVFQFHHLLREFSALENVILPMRIGGMEGKEADDRARYLLDRVGLSSRLHHRPGELSGGEQQRTAVARALANQPGIVLADEPSGNLDHSNGERLHDLLVEVVNDLAVSLIVVTHNVGLANRADLVYKLDEGKLVGL